MSCTVDGRVMNEMIRISPPQAGHRRGSTSQIRARDCAQTMRLDVDRGVVPVGSGSSERSGGFEGGLRLTHDEGFWVPPEGPALAGGDAPMRGVNLSGVFLVRALDYERAIAHARSGPHLAKESASAESGVSC